MRPNQQPGGGKAGAPRTSLCRGFLVTAGVSFSNQRAVVSKASLE